MLRAFASAARLTARAAGHPAVGRQAPGSLMASASVPKSSDPFAVPRGLQPAGRLYQLCKSEMIEMNGIVTKVARDNFKVELEDTGKEINCFPGGKIRHHRIRINEGDRVVVELSEYDMTRGRITWRIGRMQ